MDLALLLPVVMVLVLAWQPVEVLVSPVDLQRAPVARDLCKRERPAWDHHLSVSATLLDLRRRLALQEFNRLSLVVRNMTRSLEEIYLGRRGETVVHPGSFTLLFLSMQE